MKFALGRCLSPVLFVSACATPASQPGADWPQFRGPGGLSVADDADIPNDFGPEQHVLWKAPVPEGYSSVCIRGDLLVVTGHEGEQTNIVVALDRNTGEERWRRSFEGEPHPQYMHVDARPAVPTPCAAGDRVVAYFGGYGLVALDFDGELLWERRLPHPGYGFGVGPSPLITNERVILPRDGAPEAALLAFDLADGSDAWRVDRFDYGESHGSPFLWKNAEREELVMGGTRRVCAFDPATGAVLWTVEGTTIFPCTTPTADADKLYFAAWSTSNSSGRSFWEAGFGRSLELSDEEIEDLTLLFKRLDLDGNGVISYDEVPECRAKDAFGFLDRNQNGTWEEPELLGEMPPAPGKNLMVAIQRGGAGDISASHVDWSWTRGLPYVASPLLHRGRIWLFKAGGIVTCLDAQSGKPVFDRERLPDRSEYYLSPVGAGDYVIAGSAEGTLYLIDANADELVVVHSASFDGELFATPAVVDDKVYVRTPGEVWAFGR